MRKVFTLCLVYEHPKILLGFKKIGFGAGKFNGFGGKVEQGETIEDAAKRELFEEVGVRAAVWKKHGTLEFSFEGKVDVLEMHVFRAQEITGTPQESNEMRPQWFNHDNIPFKEMWVDDAYWMPLGNVQAHMAVSPRMGKWLYLWQKQLRRNGYDGRYPSFAKRYN